MRRQYIDNNFAVCYNDIQEYSCRFIRCSQYTETGNSGLCHPQPDPCFTKDGTIEQVYRLVIL